MATKPVPKPRSLPTTDARPIPAPRRIPPTLPARSSSPTSESSQSEKSDDLRSTGTNESQRSGNHEFFRSLSTSSRQLKDEISEKVTVKGRAMISSTRNASIRLERSVKNLLTRRLSSQIQDDVGQPGAKKLKDPVEEDRCVSMPTDDIFSSISFYSPLSGNLRSVRNEEDLSGTTRHSPPPPVYPPPPLPDESIYDELQSVISGSSGRYDTLSSTVSDKVERDFPESFNLLSLARNQVSSPSFFLLARARSRGCCGCCRATSLGISSGGSGFISLSLSLGVPGESRCKYNHSSCVQYTTRSSIIHSSPSRLHSAAHSRSPITRQQ